MAKKKANGGAGPQLPANNADADTDTDAEASAPTLIICRNKHWRYISSFHGPWLQLPPEILDSLAHQNYSMPAPRLVDPAVFYDIVKIRRAVDEAAHDSVRASTGISSPAMAGKLDFFGGGGGGGPATQLSKERIFKIRQKAVRLLSKAFALDEVAASVATMQATSTVEDVGGHVLKREAGNNDAKYVHFFHEKIPSRAMEQNTPLDPLNQIISSLPLERQAPHLRTRALVQIFKRQWESAAADLTTALRITEELKRMHKPNGQALELASRMRQEQEAWGRGQKDWRAVPHLKEEDQPQSLEMQLLFNRGAAYLAIACDSVGAALAGLKEYNEALAQDRVDIEETRAQEARLEARKRVKTNAKRALKDYTAFLSNFDYTAGTPFEITHEIMRRVYDLANGNKTYSALPRHRLTELGSDEEDESHSTSELGTLSEDSSTAALVRQSSRSKGQSNGRSDDGWPLVSNPKIHAVSALFAEKPPPDLPPFPSEATAAAMLNNDTLHEAFGSREAVTYHPLLTDALHSLLLCHALLQTSPTELLRHAHNAARLARISDGYPIFQAARSPARADWIEVLRRANNWIGLSVSWQKLCAPAPLPSASAGTNWAKEASSSSNGNGNSSANGNGASSLARRERQEETAEQKRERIKQESIIEALSDDRVVDEASFQRAVRARERRAMEDEQGLSGPLRDKAPNGAEAADETQAEVDGRVGRTTSLRSATPAPQQPAPPKRWAQDENSAEYPISSERADAIARWIKTAPLSGGGGKKKRPAKKKKAPVASVVDLGAGSGPSSVANTTMGLEDLRVDGSEGPD